MPFVEPTYSLIQGPIGGEGDKYIATFYRQREGLLKFFRENPELLVEPYQLTLETRSIKIFDQEQWDEDNSMEDLDEILDENDYTYIEEKNVLVAYQPITLNPIFNALMDLGLANAKDAADCYPDWRDVEFPDSDQVSSADGYSLIDLALYVVELLNIYVPNRALIHNLYATNIQIDALGRENIDLVETSIDKLINRVRAGYGFGATLHFKSKHIIQMVRCDLELGSITHEARDGIAFEKICQRVLEEGGFNVETTLRSGDFGADLVARKDGLSYAIQCKDSIKPAGIKAVQEVVGARSHYKTDYGVVCSSGGFTDAAVELATSNKVILCNREQLARRLDTL